MKLQNELPTGGKGLKIETRLNGHVVQSATTADMIFDIASLIAILSEPDFEDLISADHELLEYFTRISFQEPERDAALEMVKQAARTLAELANVVDLPVDED